MRAFFGFLFNTMGNIFVNFHILHHIRKKIRVNNSILYFPNRCISSVDFTGYFDSSKSVRMKLISSDSLKYHPISFRRVSSSHNLVSVILTLRHFRFGYSHHNILITHCDTVLHVDLSKRITLRFSFSLAQC